MGSLKNTCLRLNLHLKNQKDSTQSLTFSHAARLYLLIFQYPFDSFSLATNKVKKQWGKYFLLLITLQSFVDYNLYVANILPFIQIFSFYMFHRRVFFQNSSLCMVIACYHDFTSFILAPFPCIGA